MKNISVLLLLLLSGFVKAQNASKTEQQLHKALFKINYWHFYYTEHEADVALDSLEEANNRFQKLLLNVTNNNPATLRASFKSLQDSGLTIVSSPDSSFRIYSWDTWTGGTMHFFRNVYQYKTPTQQVFSKVFVAAGEEDPGCTFLSLQQVTANNKNYYLAFSRSILSRGMFYEKVKVFSIDSLRLNDNARLIRTQTGLKNQLGYEVDLTSGSNIDHEVPSWEMDYDTATKTISLPVILDNGRVTARRIRYKFNGTCFEKVQ